MPADRVLVEIVTAANMAGVNQAKAGFLGMSAATLGLAVALGGLVIVGKAAIANTEAMDKAHLSLQQATKASKESYNALQGAFDAWAQANKKYIPDQYAAETALSAFVRAGNSAKDSMRMLNDALDLSTLKGIDMATAQNQIELAVQGNGRALKGLGITTAQVHAIEKSHLTTEEKHLAILKLIEAKTKDGRKATTDLAGAQYALNQDWQNFTTKIGPPLLTALGRGVTLLDQMVTAIGLITSSKDPMASLKRGLDAINPSLGKVVDALNAIERAYTWLNAQTMPTTSGGNPGGVSPHAIHAAAGFSGTVTRPTLFLAGEGGSAEDVNIGPAGRSKSGGTVIHNHFYNAVLDGPGIDRITMQIARRLSANRGT